MTGRVNPPLFASVPNSFDLQQKTYLQNLQTVLRQVYEKIGGQEDPIADTAAQVEVIQGNAVQVTEDVETLQTATTDLTQEQAVLQLELGNTQQDIVSIEQTVTTITQSLAVVSEVTGDTATSGNLILVCTNTTPATITLNTSAPDGEQVTIKARDATVTITGTIDGSTSNSLTTGQSIRLIYFGSEWSQI